MYEEYKDFEDKFTCDIDIFVTALKEFASKLMKQQVGGNDDGPRSFD